MPQTNNLEQMKALKRGLITASYSPWNAPLLDVSRKPDVIGNVKYRFYVDFRWLNQVKIEDESLLPNMPFSLKGAPSTLQRLMNKEHVGLNVLQAI